MKFKRLVGVCAAAVMCVSTLGLMTACSDDSADKITVWVPEEMQALTETQLKTYADSQSDFPYEFKVEAVSESNAATDMITDVTAGADLFFFAQDQLSRLVAVGGLSSVSSAFLSDVQSNNDADSISAASVNGTVYAYPITTDNGFFMYYDTRVITEEIIAQGQTAIIAACEAAGKQIGFQLSNSGWYSAAYFFGAGCVSTWTADSNGTFTGYIDTYNTEDGLGLIAMQGMAELIGSSAYVGSDSADASLLGSAAVVVDGAWNYNTAKTLLGENLGCSELWSYTVDDTSYHLGSFKGCKLLGVKPQTDATKLAWCQSIANYLSGYDCQMARFESNGWGPSNKTAQATDAVKNHPALAALAAQNEYAVMQGQYPNAWWDASKALGATIENNQVSASDTDSLQGILDTYTEAISAIISSQSTVALVLAGSFTDVSWSVSNTTYMLSADNVSSSYAAYTTDNPLIGIWEIDVQLGSGSSGIFRVCLYNDWDTYVAGYAELTSDSSEHCYDWGEDNNIAVDTAGIYTVVVDTTAVTDPSTSFDGTTVKVTLKQEVEEEEATAYVVVGSYVGWDVTNEEYKLDADNTLGGTFIGTGLVGVWTFDLEITVEEDNNYGFRICEFTDDSNHWVTVVGYSGLTSDSDADLTEGGDDNIIVAASGTYTIVIDTTGDTVTIKVTAKS